MATLESFKKGTFEARLRGLHSKRASISSLVLAVGVPMLPLLEAPLLGGVAKSGGSR